MELTEFIEKFASCFSKDEAQIISAQTEFRKLKEWNSMMALIIISTIDEELGVIITADDIRSSVTVQDIFDKVSNR